MMTELRLYVTETQIGEGASFKMQEYFRLDISHQDISYSAEEYTQEDTRRDLRQMEILRLLRSSPV